MQGLPGRRGSNEGFERKNNNAYRLRNASASKRGQTNAFLPVTVLLRGGGGGSKKEILQRETQVHCKHCRKAKAEAPGRVPYKPHRGGGGGGYTLRDGLLHWARQKKGFGKGATK